MNFVNNFVWSEEIDIKKREKIKKKIESKKMVFSIYLIIIRLDNASLFEIISTSELYRLYSKGTDFYIVGIFKTK